MARSRRTRGRQEAAPPSDGAATAGARKPGGAKPDAANAGGGKPTGARPGEEKRSAPDPAGVTPAATQGAATVDPSAAAHLRRLGRTAIALFLLVAAFAVYVVCAAFPGRSSGIAFNGAVGRQIDKLVPQGWAFFTADPAGSVLVPYRQSGIVGQDWTRESAGPLATAGNAFGFDRSPRLQDQQVGDVAGLPARYWHACQPGLGLSQVQSCLREDTTGVYAINPWPVPAVCGKTGIVSARPRPWAQARAGGDAFEATRVLIVDLRC